MKHLATYALALSLSLSLAVIHYRSPTQGGIAGGTVLTLGGNGFATDAYATSNLVWLEGEDGTRIICDFIRFTVLCCAVANN